MPKHHTGKSYSHIGDLADQAGAPALRCDLHCQFWVGHKKTGYMAYRYVYEKLIPSKATDGFLDMVAIHDRTMKRSSPLSESRVVWVDDRGTIREMWRPGMDYDDRITYDWNNGREQYLAQDEMVRWMRGEINDQPSTS